MENDVLISMNALKRFIQENGVVYSNKLDKFAIKDAVKVVRCKDCVNRNEIGRCNAVTGRNIYIAVSDDFFCDYGERKENL